MGKNWMKENYKNLTTLRPLMELMDTKEFCDFVFLFGNMKKARPDMDVFFDVESLRSGDDWERTIHYEINRVY